MAKQVQFRRGTTSQHSTFTGAAGEITVDTDKNTAVVHDGSTAGGHPLATSLAAVAVTASAASGVSPIITARTWLPSPPADKVSAVVMVAKVPQTNFAPATALPSELEARKPVREPG